MLQTIISCNINTNSLQEKNIASKNSAVTIVKELAGNFVTEGYEKRAEGFDWTAVTVSKTTDSTLNISVRSRADKKKPSCTFDATIAKVNDTAYNAMVQGKAIRFSFTDSTLHIYAEREGNNNLLNYYCSGGASLAGIYKKINEPLDKKQVDPTVFTKTLSFKNTGFEITTTGKGSLQQLSIEPNGLQIDNSKIIVEIEGTVVNAVTGDLNSDGFAEVLIYSVSAGSGSYGNVICYSVNNGKSISGVYFPNIADNPKASKGYMGHDEFAIVDNSLVQRFQIYTEADVNSKPTGNIREVKYKLTEGEASRKFEVAGITEYAAK